MYKQLTQTQHQPLHFPFSHMPSLCRPRGRGCEAWDGESNRMKPLCSHEHTCNIESRNMHLSIRTRARDTCWNPAAAYRGSIANTPFANPNKLCQASIQACGFIGNVKQQSTHGYVQTRHSESDQEVHSSHPGYLCTHHTRPQGSPSQLKTNWVLCNDSCNEFV